MPYGKNREKKLGKPYPPEEVINGRVDNQNLEMLVATVKTDSIPVFTIDTFLTHFAKSQVKNSANNLTESMKWANRDMFPTNQSAPNPI